jgi:hypothetical protein
MIYLIGYHENESSWSGTFMHSVRHELNKRSISFTELPPYHWNGPQTRLGEYLRVDSKPSDIWLIGWAHSPVIEYIKQKHGRKFGLVVGVMAGHFDPLTLTTVSQDFREGERLSLYDGLFTVSHWCRRCLVNAYPHLTPKVWVTGFPVDFDVYKPFENTAKQKELIIFNQRFSQERLPALELELAAHLSGLGYQVQHLSGTTHEQIAHSSPSLEGILFSAHRYGLEFVINKTKDAYLKRLAKADVVITTSIADTLSVAMIEAIALGATPVAPRAFCFPEYIHNDNLYAPYDLDEIMDLVKKKPQRNHLVESYDKAQVIRLMLSVLNS